MLTKSWMRSYLACLLNRFEALPTQAIPQAAETAINMYIGRRIPLTAKRRQQKAKIENFVHVIEMV